MSGWRERREGRRAEERSVPVRAALKVVQSYWGGTVGVTASQVAEACRTLRANELELIRMWIPAGIPGSPTAARCARAREIVSGVIREKGGE